MGSSDGLCSRRWSLTVDHGEDTELVMVDVELNISPLHTNNSYTDVLTSDNETSLISQFEQLHLRIDWFENRVSSYIR